MPPPTEIPRLLVGLVFTHVSWQEELVRNKANRKCQGPGAHCEGNHPPAPAKLLGCAMKNLYVGLIHGEGVLHVHSLFSLVRCSVSSCSFII